MAPEVAGSRKKTLRENRARPIQCGQQLRSGPAGSLSNPERVWENRRVSRSPLHDGPALLAAVSVCLFVCVFYAPDWWPPVHGAVWPDEVRRSCNRDPSSEAPLRR